MKIVFTAPASTQVTAARFYFDFLIRPTLHPETCPSVMWMVGTVGATHGRLKRVKVKGRKVSRLWILGPIHFILGHCGAKLSNPAE